MVSTPNEFDTIGDITLYNCNFTPRCNPTADLIIASPPYNEDISYGQYMRTNLQWIEHAYDIAKPSGRMCIIVPFNKSYNDTRVNISHDISNIAQAAGWTYRTTILWDEHIAKNRWTFGSFMSPSSPNVVTPVKAILVFHKGEWSRRKDNKTKVSDITRSEFIEWTEGIWNIQPNTTLKLGTPSIYPIEIAKRCIKLFTYVNDTVVDPFMGDGSSMQMCKLLHRRGVAFCDDQRRCESTRNMLLK